MRRPDVAPVLSIRDLVVEFRSPSGPVRAVDGVNYDVYPGETLGVVGETGSGKSVTVLAALGLLPANRLRVEGSVLFDGRDLLTLSPDEVRRLRGRDIAMVFQDPSSALNPVHRIGDQIAEAILLHEDVPAQTARRRAVDLLALVGVPQPDFRALQYPHQFSGGMCQRAMIAMAIANRPKVLIADEPTTAVDVSVQAQLLEVLRLAQEETGAATVLISHDLGVIAETARRVCVMYAGRVAETGDVADVFHRPRHPYTAGLLACTPRLDQQAGPLVPIPGQPPDPSRVPPGCAFAPRCGRRAGRQVCVDIRPVLTPQAGTAHLSACHFAEEAERLRQPRSVTTSPSTDSGSDDGGSNDSRQPARHGTDRAKAILEVRDLVKLFPLRKGVLSGNRGWVRAVDEVSFSISARETLGLVGESGCGKTTTSRMVIRLETPTHGQVFVDGVDVAAAGRQQLRRIRRQVQMVFQDPYASLNPRLSAGDNVAEPLRVAGEHSRQQRRRLAAELFDQVGLLPGHLARYPDELSGGQRQRVAIARALILRPNVLLLDEPVSALDVSVQAQVLNLLSELKTSLGLAYLLVSHDLSVVRHMSDRIAVMYLGKIVEIGSAQAVFSNPQHPYTQALLASVPQPKPLEDGQPARVPLRGEVPSPVNPPSGCHFRTRCPYARDLCAQEVPALIVRDRGAVAGGDGAAAGRDGGRTLVACHFAGTSQSRGLAHTGLSELTEGGRSGQVTRD